MANIVIAGGGWAGVAAAIAARNAGAEAALLERTDMLLGTGLVGGIMRNNGRLSAAVEAMCLGGDEVFEAIDGCLRHKDVDFPGHAHADLYDVARVEPAIRALLHKKGVRIRLMARAADVEVEGGRILRLRLDDGEKIEGDCFVDATGSAGPQNNCTRYGNGCAMCALRCPAFGGRVSIAAKAGVMERVGRRPDGGTGAMSGSCKLIKESLHPSIVRLLDEKGVAVIPLPAALRKGEGLLAQKACQQYALAEYEENFVLLDTGYAKLMSPYYPLDQLRRVPGFENARYADPYAGGLGNSMRYMALAPRDDALRVAGLDNLLCAGEKAGLLVGHTEAIVTGLLAGHNAARLALGRAPLVLPRTLAIGDAIAYVKEEMETEEGLTRKYTFSGAEYFRRMQALGLYTADTAEIRKRVEAAGLTGVFGSQRAPMEKPEENPKR